MINQSDISIIIPHLGETKEQEYAFDECYASLRESTPEIRIVVAKNGGACHHARDVRIVSQGQCKAVNAGVAITNTPWIMITNDDMQYGPNWFEDLTKGLTNELCVSPQLVEPRQGAPTFIIQPFGGAGGDFDKQKWLDYVKSTSMNRSQLRPFIRTGFNLPVLIKKEVFDLVGGYDLQYDPWGASSDTDLQCKIELAGVRTWQNTSCIVYHFSQTSGTFESQNQEYWAKNYAYFQEKWGFERPGDPDVWFSRNLINYEKLKYKPWWKDHYKKETSEGKTELS